MVIIIPAKIVYHMLPATPPTSKRSSSPTPPSSRSRTGELLPWPIAAAEKDEINPSEKRRLSEGVLAKRGNDSLRSLVHSGRTWVLTS